MIIIKFPFIWRNNNILPKLLIMKTQVLFYHKVSNIFPPVLYTGQSNQYLKITERMRAAGLIASDSHGLYTLLPLGERVIKKLINLVDYFMKQVGGHKVIFPSLIHSNLWKLSGRLDNSGSEIMKIIDRHNNTYILSPTHEETVTELLKELSLNESKLPLRLYQITNKFRDEMRAKHGLLRAREFLMKDLYSFDANEEASLKTYEEVSEVYQKIFSNLDLPVKIVKAEVGMIGGIMSHEYHVPCIIGEDIICECKFCQIYINHDLFKEDNDPICPQCKKLMICINGVEVGHTFLLGTKYSLPMSAMYISNDNNKKKLLEMGCYGIGISRLMAVALEILSDNENLIWPFNIAPFKICLIPAKKGSKEEFISLSWCEHLENEIAKFPEFRDEIFIDDRIKFTIGKRIIDIKKLGIPLIIIIGRTCTNSIPHFQLINTYSNKTIEFNQCDLLEYLRNFSKNNLK